MLTWRLARLAQGDVLLRIDDLDADRARPAYIDDIFGTLRWLGITWDRGPKDAKDFQRHWSQRLRTGRYLELVEQLRALGQLYACDCSRKAITARSPHGYDGHCRERGLPFDAPDVAWRLRVPEGLAVRCNAWPQGPHPLEVAQLMPDPILRQRDGRPAYQIASLADDHDLGITFIVRGEDLLPSTACQLYLARLLGLDAFSDVRFVHHPLVRDVRGEKLSKSQGAGSLRAMREAGTSAGIVHAQADELLHAWLNV